jgi:hypothetical protein
VYSGKAFHGVVKEVRACRFAGMSGPVFIHTGGVFGLLVQADQVACLVKETLNNTCWPSCPRKRASRFSRSLNQLRTYGFPLGPAPDSDRGRE